MYRILIILSTPQRRDWANWSVPRGVQIAWRRVTITAIDDSDYTGSAA